MRIANLQIAYVNRSFLRHRGNDAQEIRNYFLKYMNKVDDRLSRSEKKKLELIGKCSQVTCNNSGQENRFFSLNLAPKPDG